MLVGEWESKKTGPTFGGQRFQAAGETAREGVIS
jgi:hypothetical protein